MPGVKRFVFLSLEVITLVQTKIFAQLLSYWNRTRFAKNVKNDVALIQYAVKCTIINYLRTDKHNEAENKGLVVW